MIRNKTIDILSRKISYEIWIGVNLIKRKNNELKVILEQKKIAIITDKNVHNSQYSNLLDQISELEINPHLLLIEPGESSKSWEVLKKVLDWLTELNFDRTDYIIAFGGGVVGDLVSLAASLFRRGINLIQVPTTFLSQVDSSVGGKTAINSGSAKNSIGTFYHPKAVFL
ncbi:MAG: iron-containing alcohol dehydrogenase [Paracoccaceae bacterium]